MIKVRFVVIPLLSAAAFMALPSCGWGDRSGGRHYAVASGVADGKRAVLRNGKASVPKDAPAAVKRAVAAANRIAGKPYKWGGGHARLNDSGYDCSGAASFVLRNAGLLGGQMPSRGFLDYGKRGRGKWITIYARNGHVFMVIAGLRFDTQGQGRQDGPKWRLEPRKQGRHVARHPIGL